MTTVADLFEREPLTWGLRGDPHLWREMQQRFKDVELPANHWAMKTIFIEEFERLMGVRWLEVDRSNPNIPVAAYSIGSGISDGIVNFTFWEKTALPLILDRYLTATEK